jgi:hypothetical protein
MSGVNLPSVRHLMAYTVLFVTVACLWPGRARATQCRVPAGYSDKLASYDAETRLAWLEAKLRRGGVYSTWWSASWGVIYGGLTVGQLALLPTSANEGERDEKYVGAGAAFIGVLSVAILPPKIIADDRWWRKKKKTLAGNSDPCAMLNMVEQLMVRDAADDAFSIGPLVHVGNFVVNIGAGLILGLAFDRWQAWSYTTIVGIVIGEIQVITRPTTAMDALGSYKLGELDGPARAERKIQWALSPMATRDGGGMQLMLKW